MGKTLDALLGRRFKTSKFRGTALLAVSRLAVLKNQRSARCSIARSDVIQFLNDDASHEKALLRVEQVIKEQNMVDVFVVLEGYCHLLLERVDLLEHDKYCPEELIEVVSTLIFASTRCGEFPELQELRAIFTSRFGKEFAARSLELRNNCGVNPKIIQKLSAKMPSLEHRLTVLKEIASDNNIEIKLPISEIQVESSENNSWEAKRQKPLITPEEEIESCNNTPRRKYKDAADAAQAAFEAAAFAASAARTAVELSRSESADLTSTPRERRNMTSADFLDEDAKEMPNEGKSSIRRSITDSSSDSSDEDEGDDEKGKSNVVYDSEFRSRNGGGEEDEGEEGVVVLDISRRPLSVRNAWARPR